MEKSVMFAQDKVLNINWLEQPSLCLYAKIPLLYKSKSDTVF